MQTFLLNARYRGPMESEKHSAVCLRAGSDLQRLFEAHELQRRFFELGASELMPAAALLARRLHELAFVHRLFVEELRASAARRAAGN